jgi:hypothetical protein
MGCNERGNLTSGYVTDREFLDYLTNNSHLNYSAPYSSCCAYSVAVLLRQLLRHSYEAGISCSGVPTCPGTDWILCRMLVALA